MWQLRISKVPCVTFCLSSGLIMGLVSAAAAGLVSLTFSSRFQLTTYYYLGVNLYIPLNYTLNGNAN